VRDLPSFPPFLEGEPAETKPWSTPTVEEIIPGTLPTKPAAARTNGAQHQAATEKPPDAVPLVPDQIEKAPPAADVISAPDPVPARPMLPGDRRRAEIRARNQERVQQFDAEMKKRSLH
jgi:hypothetical protein